MADSKWGGIHDLARKLTPWNDAEATAAIEAELRRRVEPLLIASERVTIAFGKHHADQPGAYDELLEACLDLRKEEAAWRK